MADAFITNAKPTTYGQALKLLVDMLMSAGWTMQGSSSGNATSNTGTGRSSTVTISIASPCVVTWPGSGLTYSGTPIRFSTTGALPTGITANTTYYTQQIVGDTFKISSVVNGSTVNTSGSQSGVHTGSFLTNVFVATGGADGSWDYPSSLWVRLQDPSGRREFIFYIQYNSLPGGAYILYSAQQRFLTAVSGQPSSTDQQILRGSAYNNISLWFGSGTVAGSTVYQGYASSNPPYGFWFCGAQGGSIATGLMMDPVLSVPEDPDPVVIHCGTGSQFQVNVTGGLAPSGPGYLNAAPGGTVDGGFAFVDVAAQRFMQVSTLVQGAGYTGNVYPVTGSGTSVSYGSPNPFNGKQDTLPVTYYRLRDPTVSAISFGSGVKGVSTLARWQMLPRPLFEVDDSKSMIAVGSLWLPWDGITTPTMV